MPSTQVSFDTILNVLRSVLKLKGWSVSGQVYEPEAPATSWRVSLWADFRPSASVLDGEGATLSDAVKDAAGKLLAVIDPYVAANHFLFGKGDLEAARRLVLRMEADVLAYRAEQSRSAAAPERALGPPTELHWVHLLAGYVHKTEGYRRQVEGLRLRGERGSDAQTAFVLAEESFRAALTRFGQANTEFRATKPDSPGWTFAVDATALTIGPEGLAGLASEIDREAGKAKIARLAADAKRALEPIMPTAKLERYASAFKTRALIALSLEEKACEAHADLEEATAITPRDATSHGDAGVALMMQVRWLRYEPSRVEDCRTFSKNLWEVEEAARRSFERALGLDPDYVPALVQWANLLIQRCEFASAGGLLERAGKLDPRSPHIADLLKKVGSRPDSAPALRNACEEAGPHHRPITSGAPAAHIATPANAVE